MKKKIRNTLTFIIMITAIIINTLLWIGVDGFFNVYTVIELIIFYLILQEPFAQEVTDK